MELSCSKLKKLLYFFQKTFCYISGKNLQIPKKQNKSALKKFVVFPQKVSPNILGWLLIEPKNKNFIP